MSEEKLTSRELKFFKELADNPTITISEAGRRAGYSEATIRSNKLAKKVADGGKVSLRAIMEREGLTQEYIAKRLKEGTQAFETRVINRKVKEKRTTDGKEIKYDIHKENLVDFPTRRGYLELAAKMRGDLKEDENITNAISINSIIISKEVNIIQAIDIYQRTLREDE